MSTIRWSDRELRDYCLRAGELFYLDHAELERRRASFERAAATQLVPLVQARVIASVGAPLSAEGIAMFARERVEGAGPWARETQWLLVCADAWAYLAEWIADDLRKAHKATVGRKSKATILDGIAEASSRAAIEAPATE